MLAGPEYGISGSISIRDMDDLRYSAARAEELRHRYVRTHGSYYTATDKEPRVWRTNPNCLAGKQIWPVNLRFGRGNK